MSERTPPGLKAAGRRFWRATVEQFEPTGAEQLLLEAACRQLDELATLEAAMATVPVLVVGSKGQEQPHPIYREVRAHRLALRQLLGALDLGAEAVSATSRSEAARKLARLRWAS